MKHLDTGIATEIVKGLKNPLASLAPKFFYDQKGSVLFNKITGLTEYYPTRTEREILEQNSGAISEAVGECATVIEPGAGGCEKAEHLCRLLRPHRFVGVDISADYLTAGVNRLKKVLPETEARAIAGDITKEITLPSDIPRDRRLIFYPGSSIGNFDPDQAVKLLSQLRKHLDEQGSLLIGVDLVKSVSVLEAAYNDKEGVTAAFNLNILSHVNKLIGANFQLEDWRHVAWFNQAQSRIEMHLEARRENSISWPGGQRAFAKGERIHTENSYKYTPDAFASLLKRAGFDSQTPWTDQKNWYTMVLARPSSMPRRVGRLAC
ncbi:MAG: L-histidine N(alpha)-methyltransferase [Spirochaetales bacterium]|nr:L-histidine N(alpha)-methyltransferase [Spirochaetales bacterium]